jgi:hypothetical protein
VEKVLQYLDDLDDLVGAFALITEKLRNILWMIFCTSVAAFVAYGAIRLALAEPPLGVAMAVMLFVILLYRSVTRPVRVVRSSA